ASPRLQAFFALTILSPSACSSMSSHTHPQNVQVACFTISTLSPSHRINALTRLLVARTGRHEERSTKLPSAEASAGTARLITRLFDHRPVLNVLFANDAEPD